jgi:GTP 3',8-cyclase
VIQLPHLETNVTAACQNRCISCNHFVPLQVSSFKKSMLDPAVMERDLAIFSKLVRVGAYGMLGGEPTLHPAIADLINVAVRSEIAQVVEVWTNGQTLLDMPNSFYRALRNQRIVMSVYPGKLSDQEIIEIAALCLSVDVELQIKDERNYPNFTQLLESVETNDQQTQQKYEQCWFKTYSRVLDNGFFYRCCTSPYIPKLLQNRLEGSDGLAVTEDLTEGDITRFLTDPIAMKSCTICAGRNTPSARPVSWREVKDPSEWLAASSGRSK